MSDRFNYDKAEADLYESGCPYSEEIYGKMSLNPNLSLNLVKKSEKFPCFCSVKCSLAH